MNDSDYREVLRHIDALSREYELPGLSVEELLRKDDRRSAAPDETLLAYLSALRERAALRSAELESQIRADVNGLLIPGSLPLAGFEIEHDERLSEALGRGARVNLSGSASADETIDRIDRLAREIRTDD